MRPFIYKRTHVGDPGPTGCFGIYNCMRSRRADDFDVVIGIGGEGREAISHGIAGKVNWIGIEPERHAVPVMRHPVITFEHFLDLSSEDCDFRAEAPLLAARMYGSSLHFVKHLWQDEINEIEKLLNRAESAPRSSANIPLLRAQMAKHGKSWPGADFGPKCGKQKSTHC